VTRRTIRCRPRSLPGCSRRCGPWSPPGPVPARTCPGPPSTARPRLMQSRGPVGRPQCAWVSTASGAGQYGSET